MEVGSKVKIKKSIERKYRNGSFYGHYAGDIGYVNRINESNSVHVVVENRISTSSCRPAVAYAKQDLELISDSIIDHYSIM